MTYCRLYLFLSSLTTLTTLPYLVARPIGTQPNFLVLFPDQWRFDWAGNLSYPLYNPANPNPFPLSMPTLLTYVSQGVFFSKSHVPSPLCAPSRSCLASGKEYDYAGVPDNFSNDYPVNQTTFYSLLRQAGYFTMTTGKDDLTKATGPGINGTYHATELGWENYSRCDGKDDVTRYSYPSDPYGLYCSENIYTLPNGTRITYWNIVDNLNKDCCVNTGGSGNEYVCTQPTLIPQNGYEDNYIANHTLTLLDTLPNDGDTPWYLQVNFAGPHPPFIVTADMMNTTQALTFPLAKNNTLMTANDQETVRRDYAAELQNLDQLFQKIIDKVLTRNDAANTLLIFASDHGEELGDHNNWGKTMPWSGSASVPFIITPLSSQLSTVLNIPVDTTIDSVPVSTMDIAGTVLDFGGTQPLANMTTVSLRSLMSSYSTGSERKTEGTNEDNTMPKIENTIALPNYRSYVSSGLGNWRMVVQSTVYMNFSLSGTEDSNENIFHTTDNATIYKLICCKGPCPGQPGNTSSSSSNRNTNYVDDEWTRILGNKLMVENSDTGSHSPPERAENTKNNTPSFVKLLYDINADPYDTINLANTYPSIVTKMKMLLPNGWCNN